ncbi:TPA: hypothetical protein ACOENN_000497 [Stenotrophomonas maltophilia]
MGKVAIEHMKCGSYEEAAAVLIERFKKMDKGALMAQQLTLNGALDALLFLEAHGVSLANVQAMASDAMFQLGVLSGYCKETGQELFTITAAKAERH